VIYERQPDDARGRRDAFGEGDVLGARRRIAAWVVVDEDEAAGCGADREAERVCGSKAESMAPAPREAARRAQVAAGVERQDPELLVEQSAEPRLGPRYDIHGAPETSRRSRCLDRRPAPELEGRREGARATAGPRYAIRSEACLDFSGVHSRERRKTSTLDDEARGGALRRAVEDGRDEVLDRTLLGIREDRRRRGHVSRLCRPRASSLQS
jgi:hypothetical protein